MDDRDIRIRNSYAPSVADLVDAERRSVGIGVEELPPEEVRVSTCNDSCVMGSTVVPSDGLWRPRACFDGPPDAAPGYCLEYDGAFVRAVPGAFED